MSVYIRPCNYGTPEPDSDNTFIRVDEPPRGGEPLPGVISVDGDLDMKQFRIINLQSENKRFGAATVGYVSDWIGRLNNCEVDWTGGTMTGDLNMGTHKLKQPGHPEDEEDVINKKYFDRIFQHTKPYDLGRYIVFPHGDGTETYHGAGSKRNIDIDGDRVFEIFNGNVRDNPRKNPASLDSTSISVPGKEKEMFHLDALHTISPRIFDSWTFIFSVKLYKQPNLSGDVSLHCLSLDNTLLSSIDISWDQNSFNYIIVGASQDDLYPSINIDTAVLTHFTFSFDSSNLVVWINGVPRKTHKNLTLGEITSIKLHENNYGIVSLYSRELTKQEIIEHYVKCHVKAFTHNEVLS